MQRIIIIVAVLSMVFLDTQAKSSDVGKESPQEQAKAIFESILAQRQKLQQGVFTAKGRLEKKGQEVPDLAADIDIFCAFDWETGNLHFKRTEPAWTYVHAGDEIGHTPDPPILITGTRHVIRHKDKIFNWTLHAPDEIHLTALSDGIREGSCSPFDIRSVGLTVMRSYNRWEPTEELIESYLRQKVNKVISVSKVDGRYTKVEWLREPQKDFRKFIWFDTEQGLAPVRMEARCQTDDGKWGTLLWESRTSWTNLTGTWVPKSVDLLQHDTPKQTEHLQLDFTWQAVNKPIEPSLFQSGSIAKMEKLRHVQVLDRRSGAAVVIDEIPPKLPKR